MLRPSYNQLIKKVNENFETEEPVVRSRYSIVLAVAKRARQVVDGNEPYVSIDIRKPLSVAVAELNEGKVKILPEGYVPEETVVEETEVVETEVTAEVTEEVASEIAEDTFAAEPTEEVEI